MVINYQLVALYTIVRREMVRMLRISTQTFLPPVITTTLYFLIFGSVIGDRIGPVANHAYTTFIAPGLIMMGVITNAYANVATSLFSMRFQRSIEELLVSPMHWSVMLAGFILGGMIRGLLVAFLITVASSFFIELNIFRNLPMALLIILLVSMIFSLAGFLNAMMAQTFDDVAFVPTFILTPMIYLGGVFYATNMLPSFWQKATLFNPIYYMVHALRHVMLGTGENISQDIIMMVVILLGLLATTTLFIKKGIGLRE
ncbi:MAG: ABC transporter permease [Legionella sp.]|jgi:ABC-2 type transport system permease protein|nr:ABC transporter permease [Legionella sp.]